MNSNRTTTRIPLSIETKRSPSKSSSQGSIIEGTMPKRLDKEEPVSDKPVKIPQKYDYIKLAMNIRNVDSKGAGIYINSISMKNILTPILNKWAPSLHPVASKDIEQDEETKMGEEILLQEIFHKIDNDKISDIFGIPIHTIDEIKIELARKTKTSSPENSSTRTRIESIHSLNQIVFPVSVSHTPLGKKARPTTNSIHTIEIAKLRSITELLCHLNQKTAFAYIEKYDEIKEMIKLIFYKIGNEETLEPDEVDFSRTILLKIHSTHIMSWCDLNRINIENLKQIFYEEYPLQIKKKSISIELNATPKKLSIISNYLDELGFIGTLNYLQDEEIKNIFLHIFSKIDRLNSLTWHEKNIMESLFKKFEYKENQLKFIFDISNKEYNRIQKNFESLKLREIKTIKKKEVNLSGKILSDIRNLDLKGALIYINHKKEIRLSIDKVFFKIKNKETITRDEYSLAVGISTKFGHHETRNHFDFNDNLIETMNFLSNADTVFNLDSSHERESDKEKEVSKVPNIKRDKTEQEIIETKLSKLSLNTLAIYQKHLNQIIEKLKLFDGALDKKEVLEHKKEILEIKEFKDFIEKFFIQSRNLFSDDYFKEMKKRNFPIEPSSLTLPNKFDGSFIELLTAWQYSLCYPVEQIEPYKEGPVVDFQCKIKSSTKTTKEEASPLILPFDVFIGPLGNITNESWLLKYNRHVSEKGSNPNTVGVFDATYTSNTRLAELSKAIKDSDLKLATEENLPIRRTILRVPLAQLLALDRTINKKPLAEIKSEIEIREEKKAFAKQNTTKIIANLNDAKQLQKKDKILFIESLEHLSENDIQELKSHLKIINTKQAKDLLKYFDDSPSKS